MASSGIPYSVLLCLAPLLCRYAGVNYLILLYLYFRVWSMSVNSLLCLDCDCAIWGETIQLSSSGPGEVDVVCFPWPGRAGLGTGNIVCCVCFSSF